MQTVTVMMTLILSSLGTSPDTRTTKRNRYKRKKNFLLSRRCSAGCRLTSQTTQIGKSTMRRSSQ